MRTSVDICSGVGGFALANEWAGVETIAFAEIDDYASRVLARRFPGIRNYGDIRNVPALERVWLVCGGPPCQPASIAGQRKGEADDRWLWPETIALIEKIKPRWICLENPLGILSLEQSGLSFDLESYGALVEAAIQGASDSWTFVTGETEFVFRDLITRFEKLGYEITPVVIPACGVGAWHRRYRVWIMGHATGVQPWPGQQSSGSDYSGLPGKRSLSNDPSDGRRQGRQGRLDSDGKREQESIRAFQTMGESEIITKRARLCESNEAGNGQRRSSNAGGENAVSNALNNGSHRAQADATKPGCNRANDWLSIGDGNWTTEPNVGRVADGISSRLDRLRCLGNAIVPQVAFQLIKRMIESEEQCSAQTQEHD